MATVNLYLKDRKAKKTAIRGVINDGREIQFKIYSGISISPKQWSSKGQYVLSGNPNAVTLNRQLRKFKDKLLDVYLDARLEGVEVNVEYLKGAVFPKPVRKLSFWEVWSLYLDSKKRDFQPHSMGKFGHLKKHLQEFETFRKRSLTFSVVDKIFLEDFRSFLWDIKRHNTQTADKYLGLLKMFLTWSFERGYLLNQEFKFFKSVKQPDSLKVVITGEDMSKLESINLSSEYLRNTRELFVLSCETGLRFSDYSRIKGQHVKRDENDRYVLLIRQQKTNDFVEIPLTDRAFRIVTDLVVGKIHPISNQKMNKFLKELGQLAGLDEAFEVHRYRGKEKSVETKPKYELLSTHTGRRTFATNLLNRGVPAQTVMKFTGHRDYKSFAKYVNIPKTEEKRAVWEALGIPEMKVSA